MRLNLSTRSESGQILQDHPVEDGSETDDTQELLPVKEGLEEALDGEDQDEAEDTDDDAVGSDLRVDGGHPMPPKILPDFSDRAEDDEQDSTGDGHEDGF